MSSRDAILQALRQNRPAVAPLPEPPAFPAPDGDPAAHFRRVIHEIGGEAIDVDADAVAATLARAYPGLKHVASTVPGYGAGPGPLQAVRDPHDLAGLELLVCRSRLGVAENGAVWLHESELIHRAAPFLTQHLAVLLEKEHMVWNMHEAYARLRIEEEGFGVFVAGPSKTADIEQTLVLGAHGPRSLMVLLLA